MQRNRTERRHRRKHRIEIISEKSEIKNQIQSRSIENIRMDLVFNRQSNEIIDLRK